MLTEDEKRRIRAEEIFRLEVRAELKAEMPPPSWRQRLGSWLNSSFGLWVLSSIALTGLTTGYTYYQNMRAEEVKKAEAVRRLDLEIAGRISAALAELRALKLLIGQNCPPATNADPTDAYGTAADYLDNYFYISEKNPIDLSTYPEYQKRNFRSLIFELKSLVKPADSQLDAALEVYMSFRDKATVPKTASKVQCKSEFNQVVDDSARILDDLAKDRGQTN